MTSQRTLASRASLTGQGLHSGRPATVVLSPGAPDSGRVFVRTDLPGTPELPARLDAVCGSAFATTLGHGEVQAATVEHLLAALAMLGVDNARIELSGAEVPILDGSAAAFCAAIREAGLKEQGVARKLLAIRRRVEVRDGVKLARLVPAPRFAVSCSIEFPHPAIGSQVYSGELDGERFEREISPARTFGFLADVEELQRRGLARGGSLENAIVLDGARVLNAGGLRFPDEFVRHKVLDALGDLALLGLPIAGRLELHKSGHALNQRLVAAVLGDASAFEIVAAGELESWSAVGAA